MILQIIMGSMEYHISRTFTVNFSTINCPYLNALRARMWLTLVYFIVLVLHFFRVMAPPYSCPRKRFAGPKIFRALSLLEPAKYDNVIDRTRRCFGVFVGWNSISAGWLFLCSRGLYFDRYPHVRSG